MTTLTLALSAPIPVTTLELLLQGKHIDVLKSEPWMLYERVYYDGQWFWWFNTARALCKKYGVPFFHDVKLHDTPDTNIGTIQAIIAMGGINYLTVHIGDYAEPDLRRMVAAAGDKVTLIGVTVLSSKVRGTVTIATGNLRNLFFERSIAAGLAGIRHITCPASAIDSLDMGETYSGVWATGVRPLWFQDTNSHNATITPAVAAQHGVYSVVMGRPLIYEAPDTDAYVNYAEMAKRCTCIREEMDAAV